MPNDAAPPAHEAHEELARRELQQTRVLLLAEAKRVAEAERRKHTLELLMRERRLLRGEIVDREDGHRHTMRGLTSRLAGLNREIKEISPPRKLTLPE